MPSVTCVAWRIRNATWSPQYAACGHVPTTQRELQLLWFTLFTPYYSSLSVWHDASTLWHDAFTLWHDYLNAQPVGTCLQPGANCDYYGSLLRISLSSPLSPWTVMDVSLASEGVGRGKEVKVLRRRTCEGFRSQGLWLSLGIHDAWLMMYTHLY